MRQETDHKIFNLNSFLVALGKLKGGPEEQIQLIVPRIFLEALAFELIVKIFYELDTDNEAPKHHHVDEIFNKLDLNSQKKIREKFDEKVLGQYKMMAGQICEVIDEPKFEKLLKNNLDIVVSFKYTPLLPDGSISNLLFVFFKLLRNDK